MTKFSPLRAARYLVPAILLLFSPGVLAQATSPAPKAPTPKASCRIEIDNAHFSTSLYEKKLGNFVKVNAKSICNVVQHSVQLTVEIYKETSFGSVLLSQGTTPSTRSGFIVENQSVVVKCLSKVSTRYVGVAYSKALIGGQTQFAGRTESVKRVPLACGT